MVTLQVFHDNARSWVTHGTRLLGALAVNELRSYVFPLYTPQGALVLQEAPPDHPHHQGLWIGLEVDGHDLWNAGSRGLPRHRQECAPALAQLTPVVTERGLRAEQQVRWVTAGGLELLREERHIEFSADDDATRVTWQSTFGHDAKHTLIGQTKEAGIGIRVPPHWETPLGGEIRNAHGQVGEAASFDQPSPWINVEGRVVGDHWAGVVLAPLPGSEPCPWFVRDYGIQLYNPSRHRAIVLAPGERVTWAVQVLAYDGRRSVREIDEMVGFPLPM